LLAFFYFFFWGGGGSLNPGQQKNCLIIQHTRTRVYGVVACHEGAPAWRADGVDIVIVEDDAGVGKGVNVRRRDLVGAVEADIVPTLKIAQCISL
jgi:hypothetical protein